MTSSPGFIFKRKDTASNAWVQEVDKIDFFRSNVFSSKSLHLSVYSPAPEICFLLIAFCIYLSSFPG